MKHYECIRYQKSKLTLFYCAKEIKNSNHMIKPLYKWIYKDISIHRNKHNLTYLEEMEIVIRNLMS